MTAFVVLWARPSKPVAPDPVRKHAVKWWLVGNVKYLDWGSWTGRGWFTVGSQLTSLWETFNCLNTIPIITSLRRGRSLCLQILQKPALHHLQHFVRKTREKWRKMIIRKPHLLLLQADIDGKCFSLYSASGIVLCLGVRVDVAQTVVKFSLFRP